MASTYENDLRLEEMATGENSGSWGTKTNTNLELIADAFSYGTETIADADTTVTIADGAADAARSLALKINSSVDLTTTRTVTLAPNTTSKVWIIENNTSGDQVLTISAGSGSNVTLPNGVTKIIATDGIGAAANVTELYTNLHNITIDGVLSLADGTNSAPSLTNTGDTNTGLYFPAADEVGITVGGTQVFKADSTGANVTGTLVSDGLTVDGNVANITLNNTDTIIGQQRLSEINFDQNDPDGAGVGTVASIYAFNRGGSSGFGALLFQTGTASSLADRMRIDYNGDIAFYDTSGNASFLYSESVGSTFNEQGADRDFRVESDGKTHMLFVDAGTNRVGINESAPSYTLDVGEATAGNLVAARLHNKDTTSGSGVALKFQNTAFSGTNEGEIRYTNNGANNNNNLSFHGEIAGVNGLVQLGAFEGGGGQWVTQRGAVFNESGINSDFRVESDSEANMFVIDAAEDKVGFGRYPSSSGTGVTQIEGVIQINDSLGDVPLFINGGADYAGMKLKRDGTNAAGGTDGWNWTIRPSYASGVAAAGDISYLKINSVYDAGAGGQQQHEVVINEDQYNLDFRVESDAGPYVFYMDASANSGYGRTKITSSTVASATSVAGGTSDTYINGLTIENNEASYNNGGLALVNKFSWGYGSSIEWRNIYDAPGGTLGLTNQITSQWRAANHYSLDFFSMRGGSLDEHLSLGFNQSVFNEDSKDIDFRVESDANTHALFVDAGNNQVVVGTSSPITGVGAAMTIGGSADTRLAVDGSSSSGIYLTDSGAQGITIRNASGDLEFYGVASGEFVFNEGGLDTDFRVESDNNSHAIFVDASNGLVNINTTDTSVANNTGSARGINLGFGYIESAAYQDTVLYLNRMNNDGTIVDLRQNGSTEGTISVSGSTVSYNGFAGRHESSGIPTTTARGTVVSTIDELDEYLSGTKQGQTRADHAKVKVSDSVGDARVYGVVDDFDENDKLFVVSVGIASVKVTGSCSGGDLLESNGDGTAKVQSDDIVRSKTIGKVTIGNSDTGVKLVSCVMYCG